MKAPRWNARYTTAPRVLRAVGLTAAVLLVGGAASAVAAPAQAADQASEEVTTSGHLDTRLTVINETQSTVQVQLCNHGGWNVGSECKDYALGDGGGTAVVTSDGTSKARATFSFPASLDNITFDAANPWVGVPFFSVDAGSRHNIGLVAGEVRHLKNFRQHDYRLERRGDSADHKEMRLIITS